MKSKTTSIFFSLIISFLFASAKNKNEKLPKSPCPPITNNTVSSSQSICESQLADTLIGSNPSGGATPYTFLWQQSTDSINWTSASGINTGIDYVPPSLNSSLYYRRIVFSAVGCTETDTSSNVLISVSALPTVASAGNDTSICNPIYFIDANTPIIGTGSWSLALGSATILTPNSDTSTINLILAGPNIFVWTISNGACPPSRDSLFIVHYKPVTASNAGLDDSLCTTSLTYTLNANAPSSGFGSWNVLMAGASIASSTNPQSPTVNLIIGQNVFEWEISSPVCASSRDTVVITVFQPPTQAAAGNDINFCGDSIILFGNPPLIGNGQWNIISGGGMLIDSSTHNTVFNQILQGNNTLTWSISSGPCAVSIDTISIFISYPPSQSLAGSDDSLCSASSVIINANTPTNGVGQWNLISGSGTISNPSSDSTQVTGLLSGTSVFEWVISNGTCSPSRDTLVVFNNLPPSVAFAGTDQNICGNATSLNAINPSSGSGFWTIISGSASISSLSSASSSINTSNFGSNVLLWTVSSGACPPTFDTVVVSFFGPVTNSSAGNDQYLCAQNNSTLNANVPLSGNGTWTNPGGSALISSNNLSGTTVSSLSSGANTFVWTISNGACASSSDTIVIYVFQNSSPSFAGNDTVVCGNTISLYANSPAVGNGNWAFVSGFGNFTNPGLPNTIVSGLAQNNTLVWAVSNGPCPIQYDTLNISTLPAPTQAAAGNDTSICTNSINLYANVPTAGVGNWSLLSGGANFSQNTNPISLVSSLSSGQNFLIWTISNGICPDSKDTVVIEVFNTGSAANAGIDINSSSGNVQLDAAFPGSGVGTWSVVGGQGTFNNVNSPQATVSGLSEGVNYLVWMVSNGVCPESYDTILVTIGGFLIPEIITPNGDNKNDKFEINAFKNLGNLKVEIFNRWGGKVFYSENYQHNFEGKTIEGEQLVDDSYLYIITTSTQKTYSGYLLIKRN